MQPTTKELENKIDKAQSVDELRKILKDLSQTTFCTRLYELCEERQLSFSEVQRDCGITKSHFYNFANGTRLPKKYHVIRIGVTMGLTVEELNELLKLANLKELYAKRKEDAIIIYGIKNGMKIHDIDALLEDSGSTFTLSLV